MSLLRWTRLRVRPHLVPRYGDYTLRVGAPNIGQSAAATDMRPPTPVIVSVMSLLRWTCLRVRPHLVPRYRDYMLCVRAPNIRVRMDGCERCAAASTSAVVCVCVCAPMR